MVTTVVGQLGEGVRPFEAMMRAFPPGKSALLLLVARFRHTDIWFGRLNDGCSETAKPAASRRARTATRSRGLLWCDLQLVFVNKGEQNTNVSLHSGVFGYLAVDGASDWSVVIRTLVKRGRSKSLPFASFSRRDVPLG